MSLPFIQIPPPSYLDENGRFIDWDSDLEPFLQNVLRYIENHDISDSTYQIWRRERRTGTLEKAAWISEPDLLFEALRQSLRESSSTTSPGSLFLARFLERGAFLIGFYNRLAHGLAALLLFYLLLLTSLCPSVVVVVPSLLFCTLGYILSVVYALPGYFSRKNLVRMENEVRKHVPGFRRP